MRGPRARSVRVTSKLTIALLVASIVGVVAGKHNRYYGVPTAVDPNGLRAEGATVITGSAARRLYLNPKATYLVLTKGGK